MTTPIAIRAAISRALALDPASESVLLTAAEVYDALGDRAQAMKAAQDAITLNNGSARAHHLLGIAHLGAGQADVALPSLRRAVDLDPYAQEYYRSLSAGYRALGQLDFAQQTDRAVEGMRPDGPHTSSGGHPRRVGVAMGVAVLGGTFAALLLGKPAPVRPARRQSRVRLVWRWVDGLGALALFSVLVPTLGRAIALSPGSPVATEVIGHVVPGLLVLALWVGAVRCLSRGGAAASYLDCMAVAAGFSGLWIISTHLQLLVSAFGGTGSVQSALFHSFAGPAMVVTAVLLYRASPGRRGDTPLVSPAIGDAPA